jgi:hypothetical protein
VLVFDRNKGGVVSYDFETYRRCPINIAWDDTDDRILVCEARRNRAAVARAAAAAAGSSDNASGTSNAPALMNYLCSAYKSTIFSKL